MQRHKERCTSNVFRSKLWAIVTSIYLIVGFIAVGIWPVAATAQTSDFGTCTDLDPSDANSIASCLTSDLSQHFATSCGLAANNLAMALLRNRLSVDRPERDIFDAERARFSCAPLAEAYRLFTEQDVPWLGCIPDGTEGTAAHMAACISHHNSTAPANNRIQLNTLNNCAAIHTTYDRLVMSAINEMDYRPFQPEMRYAGARPDNGQVLDFQGRNASYQWIGPYGFTGMSFTDRFNTSDYFRLNSSPFPYDCSIAAEAQALLTNSTPAWASCIGYSPDNVVEHFAQCVPTRAQARLDCVEGRELYESLITWANAGRRPESYRSITCDVVSAGFDRINELQVAEAAPATRIEPALSETADRSDRPVRSGDGVRIIGVINILLIASAFVMGGVISYKDLRSPPFQRRMWKHFGLALAGFLALSVAAFVVNLVAGTPDRDNAISLFFLIFLLIGSISFFGARILSNLTSNNENKTDDEKLSDFEDAEDTGYVFFDDGTTTALYFFMWGLGGGVSHGRIMEFNQDSLLVSAIRKVKKPKYRGDEFKAWYQSGEWRANAKKYDPNKINGLRLISERRYTQKGEDWPPYNILVMDYGNKRIELNYKEGDGLLQRLFSTPAGHPDHSQDYLIVLLNTIADAMKKRFSDQIDDNNSLGAMSLDELKALSEEHGIDVTFGDDPGNSTSPQRPPSSQGKKSTSDDPF